MQTKDLDFVYILGTQSQWQNNELRYSLRSLRHVPHRRVVIIGECPSWVRNVLHIPAADPTTHKIINAQHKLRIACETPEVSEDFVLMNDDFFFLQPTTTLRPTYKGTLENYLQIHPTGHGYYYDAMKFTLEWMQSRGFEDILDFETHFPMVRNKKQAMCVFHIMHGQPPFFFRSIYGNLFCRDGKGRENEPERVANDCKLYRMDTFFEKIAKPFISTDNIPVLDPFFQAWIATIFPDPSPYEATTA